MILNFGFGARKNIRDARKILTKKGEKLWRAHRKFGNSREVFGSAAGQGVGTVERVEAPASDFNRPASSSPQSEII